MATAEELKAAAKKEMFKRLAAAEHQRRLAKSHPSFEDGQRLIEQERQSGVSGAVGAGMTGFIEGMPVVGPVLAGGARRAASGLSSLIDGEDYASQFERGHHLIAQVGAALGLSPAQIDTMWEQALTL